MIPYHLATKIYELVRGDYLYQIVEKVNSPLINSVDVRRILNTKFPDWFDSGRVELIDKTTETFKPKSDVIEPLRFITIMVAMTFIETYIEQ